MVCVSSALPPHPHPAETSSQREERLWAEAQLRAERRKNLRLGIHEPLDTTMARVQVRGASEMCSGRFSPPRTARVHYV